MGNKLWRTPPAYFGAQWERYHFNVDAAADEANALVRPGNCLCSSGDRCDLPENDCAIGRFYDEETDGRKPEHYRDGDRVWCNPPYVALEPWIKTAAETSRDLDDVLWYLLLPASVDTRWFHRYCWDARFDRPREGVEVKFPPGRIRFIDPEHPEKKDPKAPNMVVIFHPKETR